MGVEEQHSRVFVLLLEVIAKEKLGSGWQTQLAELTGIKQSNLSRMFNLKYNPTLPTFLLIAKSLKINFFVEDQESKTDLNIAFEKAMAELGRRANKLPKN